MTVQHFLFWKSEMLKVRNRTASFRLDSVEISKHELGFYVIHVENNFEIWVNRYPVIVGFRTYPTNLYCKVNAGSVKFYRDNHSPVDFGYCNDFTVEKGEHVQLDIQAHSILFMTWDPVTPDFGCLHPGIADAYLQSAVHACKAISCGCHRV